MQPRVEAEKRDFIRGGKHIRSSHVIKRTADFVHSSFGIYLRSKTMSASEQEKLSISCPALKLLMSLFTHAKARLFGGEARRPTGTGRDFFPQNFPTTYEGSDAFDHSGPAAMIIEVECILCLWWTPSCHTEVRRFENPEEHH